LIINGVDLVDLYTRCMSSSIPRFPFADSGTWTTVILKSDSLAIIFLYADLRVSL
jgi:hypothetical protein